MSALLRRCVSPWLRSQGNCAVGGSMDFVTDRTVRFIENLRDVESPDHLQSFIASALADLSAPNFALFDFGMNPKGVRSLNNYPLEWVKRYREQRYEFIDPVAIRALRTKDSFRWDCLKSEGYLETKRSRSFFGEASAFRICDGCTFPILDTNGYMAMVTFASDRVEDDPHLFPAMQLIALHFHAKYRVLCGADRQKPIPNLTPRERECLTWAGCGKTDWEIGEILAIGEGTVHTHIESAKRKLGVTTRIQAVVESMRHHLIQL